jgi:hypothetical protein
VKTPYDDNKKIRHQQGLLFTTDRQKIERPGTTRTPHLTTPKNTVPYNNRTRTDDLKKKLYTGGAISHHWGGRCFVAARVRTAAAAETTTTRAHTRKIEKKKRNEQSGATLYRNTIENFSREK